MPSEPKSGPPFGRGGEREYREALWELSRDGLAVLSSQARLLYASPTVLDALGCRLAEVLGKDIRDWIHPEDRDALRALPAETDRFALTVRLRHGDGSWRWCDVLSKPWIDEEGRPCSIWICRDASDRHLAAEALREQLAGEQRIAELAMHFLGLGAGGFRAAVDHGLREAGELTHADRVQLYAVSQDESEIASYHQWCREGIAPRDPGDTLRTGFRTFAWIARQLVRGELVHAPRVRDLPEEAAPERDAMLAEGTRSYLAIPVLQGGRAVGFVDFHRIRSERPFSDREIDRLRLISELLASAWSRERGEARRRQAEQRFSALAERGRDAICEMSLDGKLLYASPNAARLVGMQGHEIPVDDPLSLVHPEDQPGLVSAGERLGRGQLDGVLCWRARHVDGSWRWLEASVQGFRSSEGQDRIVLVIRDVTEQQEHRAELERQLEAERRVAEFSRRFIDSSAAEIDEAIHGGLEAAAGLAGADRAYLIAPGSEGPRSFDWHAPEVEPRAFPLGDSSADERSFVQGILERGEVVRLRRLSELPEEAALVRRRLAERGVRSYLALPIRAGGRLIGVLGFHCLHAERDWSAQQITLLRLVGEVFTSALRRRRTEERLRRSQQQLLQSQKLEAIGTLAGGIAHDFNNQLTVILGNARYARRHAGSAGELAEVLDDLERAAEHCADLTRSLLAFSRRAPISPRPLDLSQTLSDTLELLRPIIPSSVELVASGPERSCQVEADPTQLQQVLVNLAVNARDAMPDGGRLEISARERRLNEREAGRLGLFAAGDYVELCVSDSGCGIDEGVRQRIFEPFFTTKAPGEGTGLGLATAYGIVRDSKGAIEVESEPGWGSRFRVLLPRSGSGEAPSSAGETSPRSRRVLLVEDEAAVRRLTARSLRDRGFEVLEATHGREGLELGAGTAQLDLVVADVDMPQLDGVEMVRRLTQSRPQLPALFISGSSTVDVDGPEAPAAHARFIAKPFSDEELDEALEDLLGPAWTPASD